MFSPVLLCLSNSRPLSEGLFFNPPLFILPGPLIRGAFLNPAVYFIRPSQVAGFALILVEFSAWF